MWILPIVGYVGLVVGFCFLTLSIASGLYYLSELVEEHSVLASKVLRRLVYTVIATQILLWLVDGFPLTLILIGIASHLVYLSNLRHFPVVKLTDPLFIASCFLVILNHWLWFRHFSDPPALHGSLKAFKDLYSTPAYQQPDFTEIASYFGLCVWLVPFALFVSLSAGENVLPSMGSEYATGERNVGAGADGFKRTHKRRNTGMAKAAMGNAKDWMSETGAVMGLWEHENVRRLG